MNDLQLQEPLSDDAQSASQQKPLLHFWRCFWLTVLVVSLAYAWHCFYVPPNNVAWAADYSSGQQQAVQSGKPMILFFTGEWCVPCRIMKRTVWADEEVTATVNAAFIPVVIDVNSSDATKAKSRYRVGATPLTIITDSHGNVMQQKQGGISKAEFFTMLQTLDETRSTEL